MANSNKTYGTFASGSGVYQYWPTEKEDATMEKGTGLQDNQEWIFLMGRSDTRGILFASDEYSAILTPYLLDGAYFYVHTVNAVREKPVAGTTPSGDPLSMWRVSLTFKNVTGQQQQRETATLPPSARPPNITWTTRTVEMAATQDAYGQAYANTAGDYFEGISRLADEIIYKFTKNIALPINPLNTTVNPNRPKTLAEINSEVELLNQNAGLSGYDIWEPWWAHELGNTTNLVPVQIRGTSWPRNTLRCGGFASGSIAIEAGEVFAPFSWELVGHRWNWTREVANVGTNQLEYTILKGAYNGSYDQNGKWQPGTTPGADTHLVSGPEELYQSLENFWQQSGDPRAGDFDALDAEVNAIFSDFNRSKVEKNQIPNISDPVFLNGWGHPVKEAKPPGIYSWVPLGFGTVARHSRYATVDFNVYDFLGSRLVTNDGNYVFYIPLRPADLMRAQVAIGVSENKALAGLNALSSNVLPLIKGQTTVNGAVAQIFDYFPVQTRLSFRHPEGMTLTFQDYIMADHTVLPGVYRSTIYA